MDIRHPTEADRQQWDRLYAAYAAFYGVTQTAEMRDRVWGWIHDPHQPTDAFVVEHEGRLIGLAHFRPFHRPLSASVGGFLDDLFVDAAARGAGVADALIAELQAEAARRGWTVIRWITAETNFRARAVYERLATRTGWVTYDLGPA